MTRVPSILTTRLELVSLSPPFLDNLLGGRVFIAEGIGGFPLPRDWPDETAEKLLRLRFDQMRNDPGMQEWLLRAMVLRTSGRAMVGYIGFHGPPRDGSVQLGYTVLANYRRRGFAQEAAEAMMDWAGQEHSVRRFIVAISPDNDASLAMAEKLGFKRTGEQMDEDDGLEYVFELSRGA